MSAAIATPERHELTFERSRAHVRAVESRMRGSDMTRMTHSELENALLGEGREWVRLLLEEVLARRAQVEERCRVVGADGAERTRQRASERTLSTILGEVNVPRLAYQAPGHVDLHPLDASLNLPRECYSHGVRRMVAKHAARGSFDSVIEIVADTTGTTIGKRQVEQLTVRAAKDFDAFYEAKSTKQASPDDLLVISTDGKGIVMHHEDLREGTKKAAEASPRKVATRLTPGERPNRKRMAQVAAIYNIAPFTRTIRDVLPTLRKREEVEARRPRPTDKRVFASVEKSQRTVIDEAFNEALRRDPTHARRWVVLVDGDPKQVKAAKAAAKRVGAKITIVIDVIHVIEYLWSAARALFGATSTRSESWVRDRLAALLSGRSGGDVAGTIRWWASRADPKICGTAERKEIERTCHYLADRTRTRHLKYAAALAEGLPIATGVIEGACRYLVKDRMDITGARWTLDSAEAVLRLRAIHASHDFDAYWEFHLTQEHTYNHAERYQDAKVPDALPRPRPRLRCVK